MFMIILLRKNYVFDSFESTLYTLVFPIHDFRFGSKQTSVANWDVD